MLPTTNANKSELSSAYATALLRSLQFSGVKFLRYCTVDASNNIRCKVKPVDQLLQQGRGIENQVSIADCCYAGLPIYADIIVDGTGLTAANVSILQPDLSSFRILPYAPTSAMVLGNSFDQYTNEPSNLCTRTVLSKVVKQAKEQHNISFSVGVEIEFCLVDAGTNQFVDESLFCNTITLNEQDGFVNDLYDYLRNQFIPVELVHAESSPGQLEVVLQYSEDPVAMADNVVLTKETIRAVARKHGCRALFLPKVDMNKAGNGMHVHMSIRDAITGNPVFCEGASLSPNGSSFVEGILMHLPAILGLTMPTVNSFRRVGPGCWTGSQVGWALEDKEAGIRVCSNLVTKEWDHVECKLSDASGNFYMGLAALLMSGMDGIAKKCTLRPSLSDAAGTEAMNPLPKSLEEALSALEQDTQVMDLLGPRLSKAYLAVKRNEAERSSKMTLEDEVKEALVRS